MFQPEERTASHAEIDGVGVRDFLIRPVTAKVAELAAGAVAVLHLRGEIEQPFKPLGMLARLGEDECVGEEGARGKLLGCFRLRAGTPEGFLVGGE
jgi:hypothetical protein